MLTPDQSRNYRENIFRADNLVLILNTYSFKKKKRSIVKYAKKFAVK